MTASGIRIGTPAVTSRGLREPDMDRIAKLINRVLDAPDDAAVTRSVEEDVRAMCRQFPLYPDLIPT
jgi:glycine hydroxymethyltransferase